MNILRNLLIITIICFASSACRDFQSNNLAFSKDEWKKNNIRLRGRMSGSLLEQKHLLAEKTKEEIIEILGEPDESGNHYLKYRIDWGSILEASIQKYFIIIEINPLNNKVNKIAIIDS